MSALVKIGDTITDYTIYRPIVLNPNIGAFARALLKKSIKVG